MWFFTIFRVLCFSRDGKIVTIDQLSYYCIGLVALTGSVAPLIGNSYNATENMGVRMYPSLMGTFNFSASVAYINSTLASSIVLVSSASTSQVCYFRTTYFEDLWILPSPSGSTKEIEHVGIAMPLPAVEITFLAIQSASANINPVPPRTKELDHLTMPMWASNSSLSMDCLDTILPYDETILEAMTGPERPWEEMLHRSYFLLELSKGRERRFHIDHD